MNIYKINEVVKTISETHDFQKDELIPINTSDVLEGDFLQYSYQPTNMLKGQFKKTIKKDDILFSEIRPANRRYARVNFENTEDFVLSTKLMVLRKFNENVNLDYFYYFLTNQEFLDILQRRAENRIGSFPQITFDLLSEYSITVPETIEEQKRIVEVIKTIDSKIVLNKKINKELEAMTKELYDFWFVQFDFPGIDSKPYKSSGGKMVYNTILKREIPEGWEVKKLEDLAKIQKNQITPKAGIEYKHYSLPSFDECESYSIENGNTIFSDKFLVESGNLLISKLNPWTDRTVWVDDVSNAICSTEYVVLKQNDKCIQSYLNQIAHTQSFIDYCTSCSTGTSHSHRRVKPELMTGYKVPFQESIVKAFGNQIYPIIQKKLIIQNENRELTILRDELLPMLMNGQVSVK